MSRLPLKTLLGFAVAAGLPALAFAAPAMVTVGDAGNVADSTGYGAVSYTRCPTPIASALTR